MKKDKAIFDLIEKEHQRQLEGMELIASENFVRDLTVRTNMQRACQVNVITVAAK